VPPTSAVITKKPTKKRKASLDVILSTVEDGFSAVADDIADIKSKMATKDDIANLGGQLTSVERELKSIRRDLNGLREKVENVSGFQKEIDHALERIAPIEKHFGLARRSPPDHRSSPRDQVPPREPSSSNQRTTTKAQPLPPMTPLPHSRAQ
jgi:hypothetical protein